VSGVAFCYLGSFGPATAIIPQSKDCQEAIKAGAQDAAETEEDEQDNTSYNTDNNPRNSTRAQTP
jgi:hypothetical protein